MKNINYEILSEQQNAIINSKEKNIIVSAGPGSGKTYTLIKKIKKELDDFDHSIIVTSFTKEASKQLKNKLLKDTEMKDSYIGTLDAFVFSEIIDMFKNRYLKCKGLSGVSKKVRCVIPARETLVEKITRQGINDYNKSDIYKCMTNWLFGLSNGIYEISSIAYLIAIDLLQNCQVAKDYLEAKYKTIYIDEAQDLNEYQHRFLRYLIEKCNISAILIGDKNQSIYEFRGARPNLFYELKNKYGFKEYKITVSVRCDPSILYFSNLIIGDNTPITLTDGNNVFLNIAPTKENLRDIDGNYLVLFENNVDAESCFEYCRNNDIDALYTKRLELSDKDYSDEYLEIIEEIVKFFVNINNENPNLVYSIDDLEDFLSNSFIITQTIREKIMDINQDLFKYIDGVLNSLNIPLNSNIKNELKIELSNELYYKHYLNLDKENRIMTIHSSKGLEADNVFVRIANKPFKYNEEYRRKLFVAFSRAKNKLYISYKKSNINGCQLDIELKQNLSIIEKSIKK